MSDELSHPAGPGTLWGESWYFDVADPGGQWGGYLRVGSYPNLGRGWLWLVITGNTPGNAGTVQIAEHRLALPQEQGHGVALAGPAAQCLLSCHVPYQHWSAQVSAPAVVLDLSWRSAGPEYRYERATRYEQPCNVAGEITLHGRAFAVAAPGQRDHSWGVRDWWRIRWLWFAAQLDDGTRAHVTQLIVNRPFPAYGYVDTAAGRGQVSECQISAVPSADGIPPQRTRLCLGPLAMTLSSMWPTVLPLEGPQGQAGTLFRSLCTVKADDGRTGSGWLEWNVPGARAPGQASTTQR